MDTRWKRAIESLLRRFLPDLLLPAEPKATIPGDSGEAYLSIPEFQDEPECYRHEDGLAEIISYDSDPDTGFLNRLYSIHRATWELNNFLAPQFASIYDSMYEKLPQKYTGEMRKVVQAMAGKPEKIPYSYTWNLTHIVYKTTSDPWLIEISANGVRAKKLFTCSPVDASGNQIANDPIQLKLGYYPGLPVNNYWTATDWTILISDTDADLQAFYADNALFPGCGWAADTTGSAIRNTCVGSTPDAGNGETYFNFSEYEIVIADDGAGNPASATISNLGTGAVFGNRVEHFKYPEESVFGGTYIVSFDWNAGALEPTIALSDATFYVFWNGATWVKGRYRAPLVDYVDTYDTRPPGFVGGRPGFVNGAYSHKWGEETVSIGATAYVSLGGAPDANRGWSDDRVRGSVEGQGSLGIRLAAGDWVDRYNSAYLGYAVYYESSGSEISKSGVAIPCCDREAIYHYKEKITTETRSNSFHSGPSDLPMFGGAGDYHHSLVRTTSCPNDQCPDNKAYQNPGLPFSPADPNKINYSNKQGASGTLQGPTVVNCFGSPTSFFCVIALSEPDVIPPNNDTFVTQEKSCKLYMSNGTAVNVDETESWLTFCETGAFCGQYLHSVPDAINAGRYFASRKLEATSGAPDTRVEANVINYPLNMIGATKAKCWVGDPGTG